MAFGQKGSGRMPQVRSNTSGRTSMAMSQRTPSHCPAILAQLADHRLLQVRVAVVELQRVGPAVEVRVAAVGEDQRAALRLHAAVVLRRAGQVALAAVDEVVRMLVDPGVIRRHVVGNEVEHQLQAALLQSLAQARQRRVAAQIAMDGVARDGEPGAADVVVPEVRQRLLELAPPLRIRARDRLRRRAGLPHAQEPDPVEAQLGQAVQFARPECRPASRACPARRDSSVSQTRVLIWYSAG